MSLSNQSRLGYVETSDQLCNQMSLSNQSSLGDGETSDQLCNQMSLIRISGLLSNNIGIIKTIIASNISD